MIRVNLATPAKAIVAGATQTRYNSTSFTDSAGSASSGDINPEVRKQALSKLLLMFLFPVGLYVYEFNAIPEKQVSLENARKNLAELQAYNSKDKAAVEEIKRFKEEEAHIQEGITAIEKLSKTRMKLVKVLDLLQQTIPEKSWFNSIEAREGRISIVGYASSDYEISSFMDLLAKSVYLADVSLVSSAEETKDGVVVRRFEIVCLLEKGT